MTKAEKLIERYLKEASYRDSFKGSREKYRDKVIKLAKEYDGKIEDDTESETSVKFRDINQADEFQDSVGYPNSRLIPDGRKVARVHFMWMPF